MKSQKLFVSIVMLAFLLCGLPTQSHVYAAGSVSLTTIGSAYTEDFNTLASSGTSSTVPNGWDFLETGTNANTTYSAGTGSSNTGDTYSFGATASAERAFGGLQSGSLNPTIGASFTNNTGSTITELSISYTGEQWRLGTSGRTDRIDFQFSTNATSLSTGIWTDYNSLDFSGPIGSGTVGALDGNSAANRTAISFTITGLSIPDGSTFWIRWLSFDAVGADDGLAVDDFSLTPLSTDQPPEVASTVPATGAIDVALNSNVTVTFSEPVNVMDPWFTLSCSSSGSHTATVSGGPVVFTLNPDADFVSGDQCTLTVLASQVTDQDGNDPPDNMTMDFLVGFETIVLVPIHEIQGSSHISPLNGQLVSTQGIVTAKRANGFYMQDPNPDADEATSEAIFVFTSSSPAVAIGDMVLVTGTVKEFRSGGASSNNLTTTELDNPGRTITVLSSGNPLPAPMIIGSGGRIPPAMVIEDDATGDVETSGVFDPANDGIDFYESLEGMLVQVNDAVAVGPTHDFGSNREIVVVGDNGANASVRANRGGLVIRTNDFNPERIILNDLIAGGPILPPVNVGDSFPGTTVGVIDYSFGNFKLQVISLPPLSDNGLQKEVTTTAATNQLAVGTFNVANLAPTDPPSKFAEMANLIVNNLKSPDVLGIEVLQDNTGAIDNGVVDATLTWNILIAAIQAAGGPIYNYRQIDPGNNQDGGLPGGNIRQGFLFRTDRGLSFVDRPGGNSISANAVVSGATGPELLYSPGRIDPLNPVFNFSRKPLAGEFMYHGDKVFIFANHFNTKSGDQPLFGHFQPPILSSEVQRILQAQIVNNFVNFILTLDPDANIIVLGDLNDYEFSPPLAVLKGAVLNNLIETLPQEERYTYIFDGNSQALDHILVSNRLFGAPLNFDVVHVNAEFVVQASDHDPMVAQLCAERIPPQVQIVVPQANAALQDGVTFAATASDAGGIDKVFFYVREPDGGTGTPIGYEDLTATYNSATGYWEYPFNTTVLQDGYYVILAKAIDKCGNEAWSQVTSFSIRNWAVITLLPATPNNKAGRTMPVKFSIRIAASVDPAMPFVYNEDLAILVYRCDNSSCSSKTLKQTSTYGTGTTDYRINGELYITNFKTDRTPAQYLVEIWRPSNNFLVGSFTFKTVK